MCIHPSGSDLERQAIEGATLRQLPPDLGGQTPAIMLTAYARDEDRLRALTAGFQMHLTKPVEPRQLLETIAHLAQISNGTDEESEPRASRSARED